MEKETLVKIIEDFFVPAIKKDINKRLSGIRVRFRLLEKRIERLEKEMFE